MENAPNSIDTISKPQQQQHDQQLDLPLDDKSTNKIVPGEAAITNVENNNTSSQSIEIKTDEGDNEAIEATNIPKEQPNIIKGDESENTPAAEAEAPIPLNEESVNTNASIEVQLDKSISDRLACLSLSPDGEAQTQQPDNISSLPLEDESTSKEADSTLAEQPQKSDELTRSILAGEVSDNSECSLDVDENEASDYADEKVNSRDVSDEEMFIEDQDEDVEEEEEFHEVEEEKNKASQESDGGDKINSPTQVKNKSSPENEPKKDGCSEAREKPSETAIEDPTTAEERKNVDGDVSEHQEQAKNTDWTDLMLSKGATDQPEERPSEEKPTTDSEIREKGEDAEKKELDLDEDVKNPQYIPKKGVFYEHDDRSHDANSKKQASTSTKKDEETVEVKESAGGKKASSQDKQNEPRRGGRRPRTENDRWNHDLFRDDKQKPKSKSELINAYGYDIRPGYERTSRNQTENRLQRGNNNNIDRQQGSQENQRSRQSREGRTPRQGQPTNRSRDRKPRRQNNRNRLDVSGTPSKREIQNTRPIPKPESREIKHDTLESRPSFQTSANQPSATSRRDTQEIPRDRNARNDTRGRRQSPKDRPLNNAVDDKLPPINTVMPPITTWSNKIEDMVKEEATRKESSPSRHHQQQNLQAVNNNAKGRSNDYWPQNQPTKGTYHDRSVRNQEENRHQQQPQQQHYNNPRGRYQDRDENHQGASQFMNRNHYNDRSNQHHQEWRRTSHYSSYAKPNEFEPIKTQTFENSRLAQSNMNRSSFRDARDAREIINERRMQTQQNYPPKIQPGPSGPEQQQQRQMQHHQQHQQQLVQHHQQHLLQHQQLMQHQQQQATHLRQQPSSSQQQQQQPTQNQTQLQQQTQQPQQQLQNQRQQQQQQAPQAQQSQARQSLVMNNMADGVQEQARLNASNSNTNDLLNSRPIIKTDAYTSSNVAPHSQQQLQQHSQNHRSLGGPMSQQGPNSASSHLVPSHMNAGGTQAQYYSPSGASRDSAAAAAALATAYHGYIPSGHSVMDTTRYHMTSQQLSDHGYMASPGQTNDVAAASVLHQQGMYTDAASAGGTVASSAYLAQAGSTLSPSSNIPVTGAGPHPLPPVSYLQHSQYAPPPPYSNPYSQPQHNQAPPPPQSTAYPYWTYI